MPDPFPLVELSVVVVTDPRGRVLLGFNSAWGQFSLPSSTLRDRPAATPGGTAAAEAPLDAAVRAAAEVLGRPLDPAALKPAAASVAPWNQSGSDGKWKRYSFHVFTLATDLDPRPLPGHAAAWVTRAELAAAQPVSPTVAAVLAALPG